MSRWTCSFLPGVDRRDQTTTYCSGVFEGGRLKAHFRWTRPCTSSGVITGCKARLVSLSGRRKQKKDVTQNVILISQLFTQREDFNITKHGRNATFYILVIWLLTMQARKCISYQVQKSLIEYWLPIVVLIVDLVFLCLDCFFFNFAVRKMLLKWNRLIQINYSGKGHQLCIPLKHSLLIQVLQ